MKLAWPGRTASQENIWQRMVTKEARLRSVGHAEAAVLIAHHQAVIGGPLDGRLRPVAGGIAVSQGRGGQRASIRRRAPV